MSINYQLGCEFLIPDLSEHDFFTPEEFSVEHKMIRDAAKEFVNKEIIPNIDLLENKNTDFITKLSKICGELGFLSTDIPEKYEGLGLDKISTALVSEVMGAVGSFGAVYSAQTGIGSLPIVFFGDDKQKKTYLPSLASGKRFAAYCLTEPGAGSDAMNITTRAALSKDGKYYILNGEKMFTTNAGWANTFVVYAKTEKNEYSAFIVERTFAGISTGEEEKKMGIRGSSTRSVNFQDVKVPVENILYQVGKGHKIAFNILNICRWKLGAVTLGGCKSSISEAIKYARSRFQFNVPISSFGVIQSKIASMAIKIYILESIVYRIAGMINTRLGTLSNSENDAFFANSEALEEYAVECSIAKIFGSESLDYCVDEYVQILGGYGFVEEFSAQRFYRDSRINRIWLGTNEINRLLIARNYLKRIFELKIDILPKDRSIPTEFDF